MKNRLFIALIASNTTLALSSNISFAESTAVPLDRIIISDTRSATTSVNFPGKITLIDADQIEKTGANNIVDVLRTTGGVQISELFGNGTDASVSLRGFSETAGQNTLILVDGRRLNNADLEAPDLNTIALQDIERIEITKGSASVLYGDKAVGGVINIITRSPDALRINTEVGFGSFDKKSYFASVEDRHSSGFGYRINTKHRESDNFRDNNSFELTDFFGKGSYEHDSGEFFFEYQSVDEDLRLPGPLGAALIANNREQTVNPNDFTNTNSDIGRIGFIQSINESLDAQFEYTSRSSNSSGMVTVGGFGSALTTDRQHIEFTPRLIFTQESSIGDRIITVGADIFKSDYRLESTFGVTDNEQKQRSVYLHGVFPVSEKLALTTGARRTLVNNDLIASSFPNGVDINDEENAWETGVAFQANKNLRLFSRVEQNFRFAVADEYASIFGAFPFPNTQTGMSYEAGLEWKNRNSAISLEIYQLDLDNEISFDPNLFINTNIGDSRRRGLIIEGSQSINSAWTVSANLSYLDHEITSGSFNGAEIPLVADKTLAVSANYQHNEHLSGYIEVIATSDRILGADFSNNASRLAGYAISNLNLQYKLNNFRFGLRINNLLNKEYSDNGNFAAFSTPQESFFPAPERNYFLTIQYNHEVI
ncbi:MAG: TonB-dependent receptor [Gammaproteobacteria bacterium]|nr:TonB-dependent receptor [Gammaproteobacteria bacterium]